jgi:hypothetical protein
VEEKEDLVRLDIVKETICITNILVILVMDLLMYMVALTDVMFAMEKDSWELLDHVKLGISTRRDRAMFVEEEGTGFKNNYLDLVGLNL